jgi:uncharacterized membrane protein YkgB
LLAIIGGPGPLAAWLGLFGGALLRDHLELFDHRPRAGSTPGGLPALSPFGGFVVKDLALLGIALPAVARTLVALASPRRATPAAVEGPVAGRAP